MAALTAARDTKRSGEFQRNDNLGVAAATKIWQGAIVVRNAAGFAAPATGATGLVGLGRAEETIDNTAGANGALKIEFTSGTFCYANGESITNVSIGLPAYAGDDQTIFTTATGRSQIGVIRYVTTEGVWVEIGVVAGRA